MLGRRALSPEETRLHLNVEENIPTETLCSGSSFSHRGVEEVGKELKDHLSSLFIFSLLSLSLSRALCLSLSLSLSLRAVFLPLLSRDGGGLPLVVHRPVEPLHHPLPPGGGQGRLQGRTHSHAHSLSLSLSLSLMQTLTQTPTQTLTHTDRQTHTPTQSHPHGHSLIDTHSNRHTLAHVTQTCHTHTLDHSPLNHSDHFQRKLICEVVLVVNW